MSLSPAEGCGSAPRDRDAPLALDRHPIRAHPPLLTARLDFARQLNRPAELQQFLGQGGLASVGTRNDRKAAPARQAAYMRSSPPCQSLTQGNVLCLPRARLPMLRSRESRYIEARNQFVEVTVRSTRRDRI